MSAVVRRIPRNQRLRITAQFQHQTLKFEGNIFDFLTYLADKRLTGMGTFRVNQGSVYGLEFDLRQLVVQNVEMNEATQDEPLHLMANPAKPDQSVP
jgi:hypothetical protein